MNFLEFLREAFALLKKHPKLFAPNLFLSFYYGIMELLLAMSLLSFAESYRAGIVPVAVGEELVYVFSVLLVMLLFGLFFSVLIWGMYPAMARSFFAGKNISFPAAARVSIKRFRFVFTSLILCSILPAALVAFLFLQLILLYGTFEFWLYLVLMLVVLFAYLFFFYILASSSVLGKNSIKSIFRESLALTRKNPVVVSKAAAFSLVLSVLGWVFAFLAWNPAFMVSFWISRFVSAVVATYSQTLNPTIYLGLKGGLE